MDGWRRGWHILHPMLSAWRLHISRAPGGSVLQQTGYSASLWLQQEYGQSPDKEKQQRRNLGASAHLGNLMSRADRDPARTLQWLSDLLAKALMGLAPDQSPSCWRCLGMVLVLHFRATRETHQCESQCLSCSSSCAPLGTGRHRHYMRERAEASIWREDGWTPSLSGWLQSVAFCWKLPRASPHCPLSATAWGVLRALTPSKYLQSMTMTWVNGDTISIKIFLCCTARNIFVSARIVLLLLVLDKHPQVE